MFEELMQFFFVECVMMFEFVCMVDFLFYEYVVMVLIGVEFDVGFWIGFIVVYNERYNVQFVEICVVLGLIVVDQWVCCWFSVVVC